MTTILKLPMYLSLVSLCLFVAACDKKANKSLPPAKDWNVKKTAQERAAMGANAPAGQASPHGGNPHAAANPHGSNPHAAANPHGSNPHAAANPHGGNPHAAANPHGNNPHGAGTAPAGPDAKNYLRGKVTISKALAAKVKPGSVVYISVRRRQGQQAVPGMPIAAKRLPAKFPLAFEVTGADKMGGLPLAGDVMLVAWTDQDGEPRTKQPGDVRGRLAASVSAASLELKLTEVIK